MIHFLQWLALVVCFIVVTVSIITITRIEIPLTVTTFIYIGLILLVIVMFTCIRALYISWYEGLMLDMFYSIVEELNSIQDESFPYSATKNIKDAYEQGKFY